ncbi:MAG TPA: cyclic nucleotide-binding domain-containing protein, partial [Acidimicrobiia bacterium]|nr:cyclic nucleotide-binding domain-containing protein [Acidimicrobiia bacterium]
MQKSHSPSGIGTIADASTAIRMIDALGGVSVVGEDQAEALAAELKEGHYQPGEAVVNEAELSNRLYLILKGRAEVTARGHKGPIPLATVEAGQVFGELGLLGRHNRRTATVRAITELATLELPGVAFQRFLDGQPEIRKALSERVIETSRSDFLRRATPFSALESAQRRQLASRMEESEIPAGGTIVRQGEQGDSCFLLMEGHAEVLLEDGVNQRSLGKLTEGTLFGEGALLGGETTRSATVRALTDCRLLVLERRDLLSVLGTQEKLASDIARLIKLRERARRQDGIEVYERAGPDGELITILKDPNRFT